MAVFHNSDHGMAAAHAKQPNKTRLTVVQELFPFYSARVRGHVHWQKEQIHYVTPRLQLLQSAFTHEGILL